MNALAPFADPTRLTPELRAKMEAAVERLLSILDALDGDADMEPSTGVVAITYGLPTGALDECEPEECVEPSLGWSACSRQAGRGWMGDAFGYSYDIDTEGEHDGREPDCDREPDTDLEPNDDGGHAAPEFIDQRKQERIGSVFS